jgi:uncharacterized membrane protein YeaQ/YmgE (transglycosylase-associated protein family)
LRYVDQLDAQYESDIITVVIPEFVVKHWWENLLHNQSAFVLKLKLLFRKNTVVTSVPYHVEAPPPFKTGSILTTVVGAIGALVAGLTHVFTLHDQLLDVTALIALGVFVVMFVIGIVQVLRSLPARRAWWLAYVASHPEARAISEIEAQVAAEAAVAEASRTSRKGGSGSPNEPIPSTPADSSAPESD